MIPTLEVDLPQDIEQIPDLFISLYTEPSYIRLDRSKKERLGFCRIPAKELITKEQLKPKWKEMTSIESAQKSVGLLLMNAQLVQQNDRKASAKRQPFQRGADIPHYFFA